MQFLMISLPADKHMFNLTTQTHVPYEGTRKPTQLLLKQSCEQNELSFPSFKHVGHCKAPASFEQSKPIHGFLEASTVAISMAGARIRQAEVGVCGWCFSHYS